LLLELDLLPVRKAEEFEEFLRGASVTLGRKLLAAVLAEQLPRRLAEALLVASGQTADRRAAALSRAERGSLVSAMKRLRLPVVGTLGFGRAEVTTGGVALAEVDSRTLESMRQPGLYLAGEVLDLDGPIGGHNFQAAWSTGWLAGMRAAASSP
jgi:predicted Rossmann fold flavoprotein